ncbi:1287_t:CDS:2 [Dentiscutata heterogama]|uniref:1287_t:CDS:1 n=1 Tax=Dentiscutata heterogama TaxID=1316150 RepID=A0ACA9KQG8_9GLOM|nr:1287_t:CDS:2 [Dentiscutata heterogama]
MSKENKDTKKPKDIDFSTKALHGLDKKRDQIKKCEKEKERKEFPNLSPLPTDPLDQLQKICARQKDVMTNSLKESQAKASLSNLSKGQSGGLIAEKNSSKLIKKLEPLQTPKDKTTFLPLRPPSAKFSGLNYSSKSVSSIESSIEYFEKLASKVIPINEKKEKPMPLSAVQPKLERRKMFSLPNAPDASNFFVNHDYSVVFLNKSPSEDKIKTMKKSLSLPISSKSETAQHSISPFGSISSAAPAINELKTTTTISQPDSSKDETKISNIFSFETKRAVVNIASMLNLPKIGIKDLYYDTQQHIDKKSQDFIQIGPLFAKVECMYHPSLPILKKDPRINGSFLTFSNIEHAKNSDVNNWFEDENIDLASYRLEKIANYRKKDLLVIISKDRKKDFENFGYKACSEIWASDVIICENNVLLCKKVGFINDEFSENER